MTTKDFNVYNMPGLLAREVLREDPVDASKWIRDEQWYSRTRERLYNLFRFFQDRQLVVRPLVESQHDVDKVVLQFSELTERGKAFVKSGADERWLMSFDGPGTKKVPRIGPILTSNFRRSRPIEECLKAAVRG